MLCKLIQDAVKTLVPAGFDMEIVEKHHNQKIDAPSGTAPHVHLLKSVLSLLASLKSTAN